MHILFCLKNQKNMLQREIKDWAFEAYSLTKEISSWFPWIGSVKVTCVRSCAQFLNFYERERVWIFFLQHVLPKLNKITVACPKSLKEPNRVSFDLPKVSKIIISLELLKVRKVTSLKICIYLVTEKLETSNFKFGYQINIIERVILGTLPQMVAMSLAHNYQTNLFILSYRGATLW